MSAATLAHLRLSEAARGDGRTSQTNAAGVQRRVDVERDAVLIDRDLGEVQSLLGFLAAHAFGEAIDQHHVCIGTAGNDAEAFVDHPLSQDLGVDDHLALVFDEGRLESLQEANRLRGDDVHKRAALRARENTFVDVRRVLFLGQDDAGAGAAQGFVGGAGDDVGVVAGVGMQARGHQSGEMRHIHQENRAYRVCNLTKLREIPDARVSAAAGDDHAGLVFFGEALDLFEIDALVVFADAIMDRVIGLAGEVELETVG